VRASSGIVCYVADVQSTPSEPGEFARILAAIQKRTGLSHQDIADAAGVNRSQVWRWVNSGSAPGYEPVRRLAAWLLAERPEVDEMASALLGAAGYETPPASRHGNPLGVAIDPEQMAAMVPHLAEVLARLEVARAAHPGQHLTGAMVFPAQPADADTWDRIAAAGWDPEGVAWGVAAIRAWAAEQAAGQDNAHTAGLSGSDD
jgi:transcriptional regulator with XRE-family HTH domain